MQRANVFHSRYPSKGHVLTVSNYPNWERFKNSGCYEAVNDNDDLKNLK